ncbi:MAG TPA: Rieske 2Fe-2S domain-containing protein [Dehalococcoidia bacterium]
MAEMGRTDVAAAAPLPGGAVTRRGFLKRGFWSGAALAAAAAGVGLVRFVWPTRVGAFGGVVRVPPELVPRPGDPPVKVFAGKFWLVNLAPGEGGWSGYAPPSEAGGLLALYQRCPHLGCTVPWQGGFEFEGRRGWFRCPCHGSTYTPAGVRVAGPAKRPMDTMAITVNEDGSLSVDTGEITPGGVDNPQRAVPWPPAGQGGPS